MPLFYRALGMIVSMRFCRIISFGFLQRLLFPSAQEEWTPPAALHSLINFFQEAPNNLWPQSMHGHHKPYRQPRLNIHVQHEGEHPQIEIPCVPAQGQNRRHHGDDRHHHLELAQFAGFNGKALR